MANKRRMSEGAGAILILVLAIKILFFGTGDMDFGEVLELTELLSGSSSLTTLGVAEEGDIRVIKFDAALLSIKHSDKIQLQGDVDFTGVIDDVLVFRYDDGVWKEFSRHLVGGY